jgi:hypothetical protein
MRFQRGSSTSASPELRVDYVDVRFQRDLGTQSVGDEALSVRLVYEFANAVDRGTRCYADVRTESDAGDPHRPFLLRHDRVGVVLVADHVDLRSGSDREEGEQLA